jgi:hypothetical protein
MENNRILSEQQAMEYEVGKMTFIGSYLYKWFFKYYHAKRLRNYKRYLGFMEYKRIEMVRKEEERLWIIQALSKNSP